MNFSICLIYPAISFSKMFLQVLSSLCISNNGVGIICYRFSQRIINTCLCIYSFIEVVLQIIVCLNASSLFFIDIGLQVRNIFLAG